MLVLPQVQEENRRPERFEPPAATSRGRILGIFFGYTVYLAAIAELFRYWSAAAWFAFGILPFLAWRRARRNPDYTPWSFNSVKTISVVAGCLIIEAARSRFNLISSVWPAAIVVVLVLNIVEAIVIDLAAKRENLITAIAGIMLLATLPGPSALTLSSVFPDDVLYRLSGPWILAYTAWNIAFVVNRRPHMAALHSAVLTAALGVAASQPFLWGETRAFTLGWHQLFSYAFWDARSFLFINGHTKLLNRVGGALRFVSLLLALYVVALRYVL